MRGVRFQPPTPMFLSACRNETISSQDISRSWDYVSVCSTDVPRRGATMGRLSYNAQLSSAATRLCRSKPQPRQRCTITGSPFGRSKRAMGAIAERHALARSPIVTSTWREYRQCGQWLRCCPPLTVGPMNALQCTHLNDSSPCLAARDGPRFSRPFVHTLGGAVHWRAAFVPIAFARRVTRFVSSSSINLNPYPNASRISHRFGNTR